MPLKMSLEGQVGGQQMQRWIREKMGDILYRRKKMNNDEDIQTMRSAQKATKFLL